MSRTILSFALLLAACGGPSQSAEAPPASSGDEAQPPESSGDPENPGARTPQPSQEALDAAVTEECTRICSSPGPSSGESCMEECRGYAAEIGMDCRIDCMPPLDEPCPPPGFSLVCTDAQVTY